MLGVTRTPVKLVHYVGEHRYLRSLNPSKRPGRVNEEHLLTRGRGLPRDARGRLWLHIP